MTTLRFTSASLLTLGAALALAIAVPVAASAHVTIDDNTAEPGSYQLLTFKVPNESPTATTSKLTITLPTDTPFASVRVVPVAGWTAELVRGTLPEPVKVGETELTEAVVQIVWTADDGVGVGVDELGLFPASLGPVPSVGSLVLPVDQQYSDGTVVSWNEVEEGAGHPAPVLYVNDAPAGDHGHGATVTATDETGSDEAAADPVARALGAAGLALGIVGASLGAVALVRARRRA